MNESSLHKAINTPEKGKEFMNQLDVLTKQENWFTVYQKFSVQAKDFNNTAEFLSFLKQNYKDPIRK